MARGGWRYGAGRPARNAKAEELKRIDVRIWAKRGYFQMNMEHSFAWSWTCNNEPSGSISVLASFRNATLSYRLRDSYGGEWRDKLERVSIERTRCNYGGERVWFQCPTCGRRCELLYLRFGRFACRKCNHVAYSSQAGGVLDRLTHKLDKLRKRIERGRPKGMRLHTYDRLRGECLELESLVDQAFARRAFALFGSDSIAAFA